uniref:Coiled-coil domain-containing protein 94 homolog n=1 Tax=Nicotiana tabacum TaxID=4097 RepID=A0A1S4ARZ8_TOBAC
LIPCAIDQTCLGIQIFRFYFKCTKCSAEITYKTDPKNPDYTVESGATRNFEPWRGQDEEMEKEQQKEMGDAMKLLENRTLDSKREMDIMAALDEMKSMKSRHATVSVDAMLEALQRADEAKARKLEEKDEALIRSVFQGSRERIKRIPDEELEEDDDDLAIFALESLGSENNSLKRRKASEEPNEKPTNFLTKASVTDSSINKDKASSSDGKIIVKSSSVKISVDKKPPSDSNSKKTVEGNQQEAEKTGVTSNGLLSLCQQYESDEDD